MSPWPIDTIGCITSHFVSLDFNDERTPCYIQCWAYRKHRSTPCYIRCGAVNGLMESIKCTLWPNETSTQRILWFQHQMVPTLHILQCTTAHPGRGGGLHTNFHLVNRSDLNFLSLWLWATFQWACFNMSTPIFIVCRLLKVSSTCLLPSLLSVSYLKSHQHVYSHLCCLSVT